MKLYREVKGEEDHKHILFENGKGYVCDLEPIEITEEEIVEIVNGIAKDDEYAQFGQECATQGIIAILSKLRGE